MPNMVLCVDAKEGSWPELPAVTFCRENPGGFFSGGSSFSVQEQTLVCPVRGKRRGTELKWTGRRLDRRNFGGVCRGGHERQSQSQPGDKPLSAEIFENRRPSLVRGHSSACRT